MLALVDFLILFGIFIPAIAIVVLLMRVAQTWLLYVRAKDKSHAEVLVSQLTEELVKEKEKMEGLLQRMLPAQTVQQLRQSGKVATERFNMVTVLFADIEGFTLITDSLNAERLIDSLDRFFFDLDGIIERHHIEKIKTIGDAYMCAGGLPVRNRTNPVEVVLAALAMQRHMEQLNRETRSGDESWGLRIGINTGQVISGVIGKDKLSYDIWGGAVNVASRMESSGQAGKVNVSGATHFFIRDFFECSYRGAMPVKNRGNVEMYFVEQIRPELSVDGAGIEPNEEFILKLQFVRLADVEDYMLTLLEKNLPKNLYYHNLKHTLDVYTQVELIGRNEGVCDADMLLLRTAALFHDAGHIVDYKTHEEMGVKMAYEILPRYEYSEQQIERIAQLIMATKMPVHPQNLLEEVICDADSDYLGRPDYLPVAENLYEELRERGMIGEKLDWVNLQLRYMSAHQYYTKTARALREVNKQLQLQKLHAIREGLIHDKTA